MSIEQVGATTVTNIGGNHRKFYTIHVIDNIEVRQWGRIGAQGQFSLVHHPGKRAAEASAESQLSAKERKGYGNRQNVIYALDSTYLTHSDLGRILHNAHLAAQAGPSEGDLRQDRSWESDDFRDDFDTPASEVATAFDSFNERALKVIGAAASGSTEAATTYATLREEFGDMEDGFERCKSLLETLEVMLTNEVPA